MLNIRVVSLLIGFMLIVAGLTVVGFSQDSGRDPIRPFLDHENCTPGLTRPGDLSTDHCRLPQIISGQRPVLYNEDLIELIQQIDETLVESYVLGLTNFGPRVTGTPACDNAGDWIYDQFAGMGLDVRYHAWSYGGYDGNNIEATLPGESPTSDSIYIVCGHYDSVSGSPGADDNASGTVSAIVAAHVMSQYAFNHTVRFVAFSGEEEGLLGSHVYAQEASQNGDNIIAVLNADMISFAESDYDRSNVKIYHDTPSLWIVDFADNVAQEYYDYINLTIHPSGSSGGSDHASFWDYGFDAVFCHEWNFCDYYHTPNDVIENCDMTYLKRTCRLVMTTLAELAEMAPLGTISGYVTDADNGDPLSATVSVVGTNKETVTDPSGFYELSVFDDATYTVAAGAYGYLPQEQQIYVPPEGSVQLDFALPAAQLGAIEGTVCNAQNGQPLIDVEVTVLNTPLAPEYTDENGYFFFDIPGGATYQVEAVLPTFIGETQSAYVEENGLTELSYSLGQTESFEDDDGGYTGLMIWEWGTPSSYGPGGAHWGESCWATNLDGPYGNNANSPLTSKSYDLSEATSAWFNFYHYYDTESGKDGGNLKISTDDGQTWELISPEGGYPTSSMFWNNEPGFSGAGDGWELVTFDLDPYLGQQVQFQFRFGSDGFSNGPGWYIDDVFLELTYPLSILLTPDSETVPQGSQLGFTVDASNTSDHPITLMVWSEVLLPNGTPYPGNPVFGPFPVTIGAQSNPVVHLSQIIPAQAPLGTYTYVMKIGSSLETVYMRDFFDFTVIP